MKKILVYGSLRKGEYNYQAFKDRYQEGINHIKTTSVKGFDLYSLGSYPGINESEDPNKELVVDIMECDDRCFNSINNMELGAGYRTKEIMIDNEPHTIYVYNRNPGQERLVKSGDWSDYLRTRGKLN